VCDIYTHFVYSFVNRLRLLTFLTTVNGATMNMGIKVSVGISVFCSFQSTTRGGIASLSGNFVFSFFEELTAYHFWQQLQHFTIISVMHKILILHNFVNTCYFSYSNGCCFALDMVWVCLPWLHILGAWILVWRC
jgi:hypothetical protein